MIFDVTLRVCDEGEREGKVDRESKRMTMKKHRRETQFGSDHAVIIRM